MEGINGNGTTESAEMGGAWSLSACESAREDEQASDAGGEFKRGRGHSTPDDTRSTLGGGGKRVRSSDICAASGSIVRYCGRQLHCSDEETESLLFSSNPRAAASGNVQDPSGSGVNVHQSRSFVIDPAKHKIFLSHSGSQKNFVEQLCVDLAARGYLFPFFDQKQYSLPQGKDFAPLIKRAAQLCSVAVIVLSEEFLCSKWPMIELAEFHAAKQGGNHRMNMLPLFFQLTVGDLDNQSIEARWMPVWNQLASVDKRIEVSRWVAAVRALREANGLEYGKNGNSEVAYRKEIVGSICKLLPGDLLYDSAREMVGYDRICQTVSKRFVKGSAVGVSVLGLYGTSGLGKTTLSKALCDYFTREFEGRVCHVELGALTRMKRQEWMLKALCGIEEDVLNRIADDRKGLKLMRDWMKWEPVLLIIDNLNNDESSRREAHEYLTVGFHPESKIMITARSREILQDLLPGVEFCMIIPKLNEEEAGMIFLRSAAPMKCFSSLTDEERRVLRLCTQKCLLESDPVQDENLGNSLLANVPQCGAYHPLALSALGDFFYRLSGNTEMLLWKDTLEENHHLMRVFLQSPNITSIFRMQFSTFSSSEQLLFLDIALYRNSWLPMQSVTWDFDRWLGWLSVLHGETASVIERRLRDLKRYGLIDWVELEDGDCDFRVHSLYREFAEWYVTENGVTGLKNNAWGVFQPCGNGLKSDHPGSKCISDLVRLRVFDSIRASIWILASRRTQELHNLVLLQLHSCTNLRLLSLAGLDSLRHLELVKLPKLVTVTLTESSGSQEDRGILESLQYVVMEGLDSLTHVPDFRACMSLRHLSVSRCHKVTDFEGVECSHVREMSLQALSHHQLERPPNFRSLQCLRQLHIAFDGYVDLLDAMDRVSLYNLNRKRGDAVKDSQDSDERSDESDAYRVEDDAIMTIINKHLEDHFVKEGLGIIQDVLSDVYLQEIGPFVAVCCPWLLWSFNEDDKEELFLCGSHGYDRVIEWRFRDPHEYDN